MKTLERVARAMSEQNDDPDAWPMYMTEARAALIALLEPSEEMIEAGSDRDGKETAYMVWEDMIQQALKEGEEG